MPQVEFEPTIPVSERKKTVHALDRPATVIGNWTVRGHIMRVHQSSQITELSSVEFNASKKSGRVSELQEYVWKSCLCLRPMFIFKKIHYLYSEKAMIYLPIVSNPTILAIFSYWLTDWLTNNFMELSPSWETASCAATQEFPSILRNPKVTSRVHKRLSLVPILSRINPVDINQTYLSKIHFDIIHASTSLSS
jgi:hypothetical protein